MTSPTLTFVVVGHLESLIALALETAILVLAMHVFTVTGVQIVVETLINVLKDQIQRFLK